MTASVFESWEVLSMWEYISRTFKSTSHNISYELPLEVQFEITQAASLDTSTESEIIHLNKLSI